jgi:hypothetical protein
MRKVLAILDGTEIKLLEIAFNNISCAGQLMRPDALPAYAPSSAADKFFRQAIFAYADALYFQESCWRDLASIYGLRQKKDLRRLRLDHITQELFVEI